MRAVDCLDTGAAVTLLLLVESRRRSRRAVEVPQFVILDEAFFCHTFTDLMVKGCPRPVLKMKNMCC
jgi:hypothetical protein